MQGNDLDTPTIGRAHRLSSAGSKVDHWLQRVF